MSSSSASSSCWGWSAAPGAGTELGCAGAAGAPWLWLELQQLWYHHGSHHSHPQSSWMGATGDAIPALCATPNVTWDHFLLPAVTLLWHLQDPLNSDQPAIGRSTAPCSRELPGASWCCHLWEVPLLQSPFPELAVSAWWPHVLFVTAAALARPLPALLRFLPPPPAPQPMFGNFLSCSGPPGAKQGAPGASGGEGGNRRGHTTAPAARGVGPLQLWPFRHLQFLQFRDVPEKLGLK